MTESGNRLDWLKKVFRIKQPKPEEGKGVDGPSLQPQASGFEQGKGVNVRPPTATGQSGGERITNQDPLKDSV